MVPQGVKNCPLDVTWVQVAGWPPRTVEEVDGAGREPAGGVVGTGRGASPALVTLGGVTMTMTGEVADALGEGEGAAAGPGAGAGLLGGTGSPGVSLRAGVTAFRARSAFSDVPMAVPSLPATSA